MRKWLVVVGLIVVAGGGCLWLLQSQRSDDGLGGDSTSGESGRTDGSSELLAGKAAPTLTGRAAARVSHVAVALQGRVEEATSGDPIVGAFVLLFRTQPMPVFREARSDKTGAFRVEGLTSGLWWTLAFHAEYMPLGLRSPGMAMRGDSPPQALRVVVLADGSMPDDRVLRLTAGVRLRGRVIDESGAGVADARIFPRNGNWIDELEKRVGVPLPVWKNFVPIRSDADGSFSFGFLRPTVKRISVGAEKEGLVGKWSDPVMPSSGEEVVVRLVRPATIRGRVTTPNGDPALGVSVHWESPKEWIRWVNDVSTDAEGVFTLADVPPTDVLVEANWVDPYMDGPEALALDGLSPGEVRTGISIVVLRRYVLRARVRSPKGVVLQHESLAIMDGPNLKIVDTERSDEDGLVTFVRRTPGPLQLVHRTVNADVVVAKGIVLPTDLIEVVGEPTDWVRFKLRILDSDGALAPGYWTRVRSLAGDARRNDPRLRDDVYNSQFRHDDYSRAPLRDVLVAGGLPVSVEVRASAMDSPKPTIEAVTVTIDHVPASGVVDVTLPTAGVFSGTVMDPTGRPVPGVQMKVVGRGPEQKLLARVPIAADGSFAIPIPKTKRNARVVINPPEGFLATRPRTFDPRIPLHHIVLYPAGVVSGRVEVPNRADVTGKELLVVEWDGALDEGIRRSQSVSISEEGKFEARRVPLDRALTIGCDARLAREANIVLKDPLTGVRAGQRDLQLVFQSVLSIHGTVRIAGGQRHVIWVAGIPHEGGDPVHSRVAADGTFELRGLSHQTYALTLSAGSAVLDRRDVRAGQSVTIDVGLRSSLSVRADTSGSVQVYVAGTVQRAASAYARAGKTVEIGGLRSDVRYDVSMTDATDGAAYQTDVAVGATVELRIQPAVYVRGAIEGDARLTQGVALFVLGRHGCFDLTHFDGQFGAHIAPGRYDIVALLADGTKRVLLRNATVGPDELVVNLTLK